MSAPIYNNFDPSVWGKYLWYMLHLITFSYPSDPTYIDQRGFNDFFTNLQYVIPCMACRQHYAKHLIDQPIEPYLDNRDNLITWLTDIHNKVNIIQGKPTLSIADVYQRYSNPPVSLNYNNTDEIKIKKKTLIIISLIIAAGLYVFYVYYYK